MFPPWVRNRDLWGFPNIQAHFLSLVLFLEGADLHPVHGFPDLVQVMSRAESFQTDIGEFQFLLSQLALQLENYFCLSFCAFTDPEEGNTEVSVVERIRSKEPVKGGTVMLSSRDRIYLLLLGPGEKESLAKSNTFRGSKLFTVVVFNLFLLCSAVPNVYYKVMPNIPLLLIFMETKSHILFCYFPGI